MHLCIDRRRFTAGAAAATLLTAMPRMARADVPHWRTDSRVDVSGHNPQVSGAPAAAAGASTLLSVYIGEGGKNLWYSGTGPSFTWQGNQPVKDPRSGDIITSSGGRPGLCYVSALGLFLMVVPGQRVFDTWKYAFAPWSPLHHQEDITVLQFSDPALGDTSDFTHMLICDNLGNLLWYRMDHKGGSWTAEQRVAAGMSPSIASDGDTLHALYWDTDQKAFVKLTLTHGAPSWQSRRVFPHGPTPKRGAAIASLNGQLYVIFTAQGNDLYCAGLNPDGSMGPPQPIAPDKHAAATDAAPSAAGFQGALAVLHQGQSSKNLWFAVSDRLLHH